MRIRLSDEFGGCALSVNTTLSCLLIDLDSNYLLGDAIMKNNALLNNPALTNLEPPIDPDVGELLDHNKHNQRMKRMTLFDLLYCDLASAFLI